MHKQQNLWIREMFRKRTVIRASRDIRHLGLV